MYVIFQFTVIRSILTLEEVSYMDHLFRWQIPRRTWHPFVILHGSIHSEFTSLLTSTFPSKELG